MIVLGLDAASTACSAAVLIDGRVAAERFVAMQRGQAEALIPMIDEALAGAAIAAESLGVIAVTVGPGAFTGVRIGLAAARGLAVALGLPCVGVTTFEAVAEPALPEVGQGDTLVAAIESKREEIFLQAFGAGLVAVGEPFAASPEDAPVHLPRGELIVTGDAAERLMTGLRAEDRARARIATASGPPRAACVARIGARRVAAGPVGDLPRPFYLRPPDARPMMDAVKP